MISDFRICLKGSIMIILLLLSSFCTRFFALCLQSSFFLLLAAQTSTNPLLTSVPANRFIIFLLFPSKHKPVFNFCWVLNKSMGYYASTERFCRPRLPVPNKLLISLPPLQTCGLSLSVASDQSLCWLWLQVPLVDPPPSQHHCTNLDFTSLTCYTLLASRVLLLKFPINVLVCQTNYHFLKITPVAFAVSQPQI